MIKNKPVQPNETSAKHGNNNKKEKRVIMLKVNSTDIYEWGYDKERKVLMVVFNYSKMKRYDYKNVMPVVWEKLKRNNSAGIGLKELIIGRYQFTIANPTH